jgi:putative endonuclease
MSGTQKNIRWRKRGVSPHPFWGSRYAVSRWHAKLLNYYCRFIGRWGERRAAKYLQKSEVWIIKKNWRSRKLECDLIGIKGRTLLLVEVKTRRLKHAHSFSGLSAFTLKKEKHLKKLLSAYKRRESAGLRRFGISTDRIDLVEIYYELNSLLWPKLVALNYREGISLEETSR